jgi:GNAT superfamily N-acetyltransferase
MPCFTIPLHESNDCHEPAGSPAGGQFCSKTGAAKTLTNVRVLGPRERYPANDPRFFPGGEIPDDMWLVVADEGWIELAPSKHYMGPHLLVGNVSINPDLRGQGYGQALYLAAAKAAKVIGKKTWPEYRGIFSSPGLRSELASQAWEGLKRRYPKRVKRGRGRAADLEVLERWP